MAHDVEKSSLSLLHDLAFLYLELAHGADEDLDASEQRAIAVKLKQWLPGRDPALIDHVIREATLSYLNHPDRKQLNDVVASLGASLETSLCQTVLRDLRDIAHADGKVVVDEKKFIQNIANAWNVSLDGSIDQQPAS